MQGQANEGDDGERRTRGWEVPEGIEEGEGQQNQSLSQVSERNSENTCLTIHC